MDDWTPHVVWAVLVLALVLGLAAQRGPKRWPGGVAASDRAVALLVTAHPDDEIMFFLPAVRSLQAAGFDVSVLCLSNGGYDGLGKTREKEAVACCTEVMGLKRALVRVLDDEALQDGPASPWAAKDVGAAVQAWVAELEAGGKHRVEALVTFDDGGVSGHPNHIDTARGVRALPPRDGQTVWELLSAPVPVKFSGAIGAALALLLDSATTPAASAAPVKPGAVSLVGSVSPDMALALHRGMQAHRSQYVWFRSLYVAFSRYAFVAEMRRLA
ncbi:hypothetical protein FNF27_07118 [Cafeteria roenbergensis]|uniref:N-acetylglucosaminylphosphatidylinositol deacetylase n=1 Tax=Cafeteria roenbergensis TaxID=33653 RepID=A0A5A8DU26_CAFRO|nr:hypothetical protein FNF27_07118 [Cafeteria roenbergensis]